MRRYRTLRCVLCDGRGWYEVTVGDTGNVVYDEDGNPETSRCQGCHGTGVCQVCNARDMTFCNACYEYEAQVLKTILGHSKIAITLDLYGHVLKDTKVTAMNQISIAV